MSAPVERPRGPRSGATWPLARRGDAPDELRRVGPPLAPSPAPSRRPDAPRAAPTPRRLALALRHDAAVATGAPTAWPSRRAPRASAAELDLRPRAPDGLRPGRLALAVGRPALAV